MQKLSFINIIFLITFSLIASPAISQTPEQDKKLDDLHAACTKGPAQSRIVKCIELRSFAPEFYASTNKYNIKYIAHIVTVAADRQIVSRLFDDGKNALACRMTENLKVDFQNMDDFYNAEFASKNRPHATLKKSLERERSLLRQFKETCSTQGLYKTGLMPEEINMLADPTTHSALGRGGDIAPNTAGHAASISSLKETPFDWPEHDSCMGKADLGSCTNLKLRADKLLSGASSSDAEKFYGYYASTIAHLGLSTAYINMFNMKGACAEFALMEKTAEAGLGYSERVSSDLNHKKAKAIMESMKDAAEMQLKECKNMGY